ncbi:hypothetical protein [Endozoicomonas sp. GU-1]|uniref:hypothetical protein n=1 Tax=Endozoicomonas sp. GU-1 TaxID=3009078 RepID=UPI0022B5D436|nr:hypothetical protein [Endozoicomonas sp. GU-1]WBA83219.1 hypothetical protein O2T12_08925 [Endozoicomonas sp. GU-1]WBA86144.1 hypothetical protein O3276_23555 [Endozoicomonas sp. GU-1]
MQAGKALFRGLKNRGAFIEGKVQPHEESGDPIAARYHIGFEQAAYAAFCNRFTVAESLSSAWLGNCR